jgi:hypothetical protein
MNDIRSAPPAVSVVVPVRNEAGNVAPLVAEIAAALGNGAPSRNQWANMVSVASRIVSGGRGGATGFGR